MISAFPIVVVVLFLWAGIDPVKSIYFDPDSGITCEQMVRSRNFGFETHLVTTEDGYILTLQRVINPLVQNRATLKPVILQHGIMGNGINWVMANPFLYSKQSKAPYGTTLDPSVDDYLGDNLGFDVALTKRYDVWLANSRGSMGTGVRQHVNLTTFDPRFWAFSWDEMGRYDHPAIIDYILQKTGRTTLSYIGHSQGTTSLFVLLSMRPEYADKIQPAVALAPVSFIAHMSTPIRFIIPELTEFCLFDGQFIVSEEFTRILLEYLCPFDVVGLICQNIFFLISGFDYKHMNDSRMSVYGSYIPGPTSIRQVCHFYQNYRSGRFAMFDYGNAALNWARYTMNSPPDYPLGLVSANANIAFYMGMNDFFSNYQDLDSLKTGLSRNKANIIKTYTVPDPVWAHLDFVFGSDAGNLVFKDVIDTLDKYLLV